MSFAQTLWDSLTNTYVHPVCTEPTNDDTSDRQEQQLAAFQQLGASYAQQECYSQPPQPLQYPVLQLQCDEYPGPRSEVQTSSYALQVQHPYPRVNQYANQCNNGLGGGYFICQQAQYGFVHSTASPPLSGISPNDILSHKADPNEQALSTHWGPSRPSNGAHGGDANGSSQQQPSYAPAAYSGVYTGRQRSSEYSQYGNTACASYLSPAGVPFDLHQSSTHAQIARVRTDNDEPSQQEDANLQPGTYKAFYHAYGMLVEDGPSDRDLPQYKMHSATVNPLLADRSNPSDDKKAYKKHSTFQTCSSPKSSLPRTQPYQDRKEGKYMQGDKQSGFGIAAPVSKAKPHHTTLYSFTMDRGRPRDPCHGKRQLRNVGRVSSHRARFGGEKEHEDDHLKSSRANISKGSNAVLSQTVAKHLSRTRDHHGRGLRSARFSREDRDPVSIEKPPSRTAHESHTARLVPEIPIASATIERHAHITENSAVSSDILQTTASKVCPISTAAICRSRKACVPQNHNREIKAGLLTHELHVTASFVKGLAGGIRLSTDRQKAFDSTCGQEDRKLEARTDSADCGVAEEYVFFNARPCSRESSASREDVIAVSRATGRPSKTSVHRHSMRDSMLLAPSPKHFGESASADCRGTTTICAAGKMTKTVGTTCGRVGLAAPIAQDDGNMAATARENPNDLEGRIFCTEFQDVYKEKIATVVHEKTGNSSNSALAVLPDEVTIKEEEKQTGGNEVMVDDAYDSDSSDGGIALSLSDLETNYEQS